ncbi:hypothetical protein GCM10007938_41760 [Vibrio zhanjiangensis]|uniref:Uncharacterized protein n=1 Tax=Vibrio zhanjiangensis TaxID=1046128 RepID=A0ABQ6F4C8_9VIBR|nr:hypothetical protein GCM10007938_41760 [Vibrio zhanjiangensis]
MRAALDNPQHNTAATTMGTITNNVHIAVQIQASQDHSINNEAEGQNWLSIRGKEWGVGRAI